MSNLGDFWKNAHVYEDNIVGKTSIAEQDYQILKDANLLISESEWKTNPNDFLLHSQLRAEPFVGDLDADIYIVTLNPGVDADEYVNWQNETLKKLADDCVQQKETDYPFYYLNPMLSGTGGALYWIEKVDRLPNGKKQPISHHKFYEVANLLETKYGDRNKAIKRIAQKVCDLELCPYHSSKWDGKHNDVIKQLPSVKAMVDFLQTVVIPGVINKDKVLIVGRAVKQITQLLEGITFNCHGKKITFDDLDKECADNVVFYRTRGTAVGMFMTPGSAAGKLLIKKL
jgi:hypothetical protein